MKKLLPLLILLVLLLAACGEETPTTSTPDTTISESVDESVEPTPEPEATATLVDETTESEATATIPPTDEPEATSAATEQPTETVEPTSEPASSSTADAFVVGACTNANIGAMMVMGLEVVDCESEEAKSRIVEIVEEETACGGVALSLTGADAEEKFYCLEEVLSAEKSAALDNINALFQAQIDALASGDDAAYLATFGEEIRADQSQTAATNTAQLPIEVSEIEFVPQTRISDNDIENGRVSQENVQLTFNWDGFSDNPFIYRARVDIELVEGDWLITRFRFTDKPPFWYLHDVVWEESEHFYLMAASADELATLAAEAEEAYTVLQEKALPLADRYLVYLTAEQNEFRDLTGGGSRTLGIANSFYAIDSENGFSVSNRIFFINGEAFEDEALVTDRPTTIRHELVHLIMSDTTRPFTPPWLSEGIAVYYADQLDEDGRAEMLANDSYAELSLVELTEAQRLGQHDVLGQRVGTEYLFSGEVFRYLVDEFGEEAALDFYRSFTMVDDQRVLDAFPALVGGMAAQMAMTDFAAEITPELLSEQFDLTIEELEEAVRARLDS